jgi:hypothetical protein
MSIAWKQIRSASTVAAERVGAGRGREQGFHYRPNGIKHFGVERAHDVGTSTRSSGVGSHSGSNPSQHDDRWMV